MLNRFLISSLQESEVGHFALDTIKNVFWFCLLGLAALAVQLFIQWLERKGAFPLIVSIVTGVEYALIFSDLIWFLSRLCVNTVKAVVRAAREIQSFLQHAETE